MTGVADSYIPKHDALAWRELRAHYQALITFGGAAEELDELIDNFETWAREQDDYVRVIADDFIASVIKIKKRKAEEHAGKKETSGSVGPSPAETLPREGGAAPSGEGGAAPGGEGGSGIKPPFNLPPGIVPDRCKVQLYGGDITAKEEELKQYEVANLSSMLEMPAHFRFATVNKEYEWEMWAVPKLITRLQSFQIAISEKGWWTAPIPIVSAYRRLGTHLGGDPCGINDKKDGEYGHWRGCAVDVNRDSFIVTLANEHFEGDTKEETAEELDKYLAFFKLGRPHWRPEYVGWKEINHITLIEHPRCQKIMTKIGRLPIKYSGG